jgi:acyl carrier protein
MTALVKLASISANDPVFQKVQKCFADALGADPEDVILTAKVIDDLGAESLDFLDIAYRLEQSFKIKIPRGEIKAKSQEGLTAADWEVDGVLTQKALDKLVEAMPEVDPAEIKPGLRAKDIPRLFTVATFYAMVVKLLAEKEAAASSAPAA